MPVLSPTSKGLNDIVLRYTWQGEVIARSAAFDSGNEGYIPGIATLCILGIEVRKYPGTRLADFSDTRERMTSRLEEE